MPIWMQGAVSKAKSPDLVSYEINHERNLFENKYIQRTLEELTRKFPASIGEETSEIPPVFEQERVSFSLHLQNGT